MISYRIEVIGVISIMVRAIVSAFFCVVLCSCYATCVGYTYADCGSKLGKFTDVSVSNCETTDERCILKRGVNATISIKFIPNIDVSQVNLYVYGVILDIPIPFPMNNMEVCKDPDSGVKCPLQKDQESHYTTTMLVEKSFPSVKVDIKWEFVNENKQMIVCINFPATLK